MSFFEAQDVWAFVTKCKAKRLVARYGVAALDCVKHRTSVRLTQLWEKTAVTCLSLQESIQVKCIVSAACPAGQLLHIPIRATSESLHIPTAEIHGPSAVPSELDLTSPSRQ
jgi:hypothetical protein